MSKSGHSPDEIIEPMVQWDARRWTPELMRQRRHWRIFTTACMPSILTILWLFHGQHLPIIVRIALYFILGSWLLDVSAMIIGLSTVALASRRLSLRRRLWLVFSMLPRLYFQPQTGIRAMKLAIADVRRYHRETDLISLAQKFSPKTRNYAMSLIAAGKYDAADRALKDRVIQVRGWKNRASALRQSAAGLPCEDAVAEFLRKGDLEEAEAIITRTRSILQRAEEANCTSPVEIVLRQGAFPEAEEIITIAQTNRAKTMVLAGRDQRISMLNPRHRSNLKPLFDAVSATEYNTRPYRTALYVLDQALSKAEREK